MKEKSIVPIDFNRLQTLIKGDNYAYRDEFYQHFHHFKALYRMLLLNPSNGHVFISKLALFLSNVVYLYNDVSDEFSYDILFLLKENFTLYKSSFIFTLSKCVVILRNYKVISIDNMIEIFLHLFTLQSKCLRKFIFTQLLFQICKVSSNSSIKCTIQNGFHSQFLQENLLKQYLASELTIELFNRNIWNNEKSVFLLQLSVLSKVRKISVNAVRFFIRPIYANSIETSSSSDEDFYEISKLGNRKRKITCMKNAKSKHSEHSFHAIDLVRDPNDFVVNLIKRLESKNDQFEHLLEKICLIGLLIWTHKLVVPQFYTFLQRYLKPHQQQVTRILAYLSQAVHELLDESTLEPLVQSIISNFVTEHNTAEAMTVGLNTVREIALKCPGILTQELLSDLIRYRKFKNKNVVMASRSLLQLYRHVDRELLPKRDRGKPYENGSILPVLKNTSGLSDDFLHGVMLLESINKDSQNEETDNTLYEKLENAKRISQSRILSQSEHGEIRRKTKASLLNSTFSNQQLQLNYRLMKDGNGIVTVSDLEYFSKKPNNVALDDNNLKIRGKLKLNSKSKFGRNKQQCRNKNFMMVSHGKPFSTKEFKPKKKGFQSKNYKMKRILSKEYNKIRSSL